MSIPWRETFATLRTQFEARAAKSAGIYHMMVEAADDERDKMLGPEWFNPVGHTKVVDGAIQYGKWDCSRFSGLPGVSPGFREPDPNEVFGDDDRVIRDKSGVVRAVPVQMKLRQSYFCGGPSDAVTEFESLADMAARALASADLTNHFFAQELTDIFRQPRGGIRYVFGDVPAVPDRFISQGWAAGVLAFENGVLVDMPISESSPDSSHWMLLLHRLGWRQVTGSGLVARRATWDGNTEVDWEMVEHDWSYYPDDFASQFRGFSKTSFYSVLGTKESPIDIYLASALAVQLLLADLNPNPGAKSTDKTKPVDYSQEPWKLKELPAVSTVDQEEAEERVPPLVGIIVATEVERLAALKRLQPPSGKKEILQVFRGSNTYFLGRLGVTNIALVMTSTGAVGRDSSTIITTELLDHWKVRAVIMLGIAFGKDSDKQMIGGVLVSEQIINYEPQRLGQVSNEDRGDRTKSGSLLLNRFRNVLGWQFSSPDNTQCSFQVGPILSGENLVDNLDEKLELFERFPTAIGGEMEGAGVAAAAERKRREWIVVKAICDWADGNKDKSHQEFAAAAAVSLVEHVLNQHGALKELGKND